MAAPQVSALSHIAERVPARSLAPGAPTGLEALLFHSRPAAGETVRVLAVGDIGLSGRVAAGGRLDQFRSTFADVRPILKSGDIVFGNLEYPLAGDVASGNMFAGDPEAAHALADAGFTLLHLANNHVAEYGVAGLHATLSAVQSAGITPLGAGATDTLARRLVRTDCNKVRVGWLGSGRTLEEQAGDGARYWEYDRAELEAAVKVSAPQVDVLIVSIHIGMMFLDYPAPDHYAMANSLLSLGATLILMHHAHVLQGVQVSPQGTICCYNLGNFLIDWREGNVETPMMVKEQQESAVFLFDFDRSGIVAAAALPTMITSGCKVQWALAAEGDAILHRLLHISEGLKTDFGEEYESQRVERNTGPVVSVLLFHLRRGNFSYVLRRLRRVRFGHVAMLMSWSVRRLQTFIRSERQI